MPTARETVRRSKRGQIKIKIKMDSSFRWNDDVVRPPKSGHSLAYDEKIDTPRRSSIKIKIGYISANKPTHPLRRSLS
jgi:hypothetical protein